MQLRLKTKITLSTALLVLFVVALISSVYVGWLAEGAIRTASERAQFVTQQVFLQSQKALEEATDAGAAPVSDLQDDLQAFVRMALEENAGLTSQIDSSLGYGKSIYEVSIVDREQTVLISSDPSMPGRKAFTRQPLERLSEAPFFQKLRVLYGPPLVYEVTFPFNLSGRAFGEIRVGLSTALLRNEIAPQLKTAAWLALGVVIFFTGLAALVSHRQLAPLSRITAQLDRIARGEFDAVAPSDLHKVGALSGDELGQVSTKISRIGEQLRGVQEIFGSLRENVEQVMSGMDDGLILFTPDSRAVLVSRSVERYLGVPRQELLGKRVGEIFPPGHPVQRALHIESNKLGAADSVEVRLPDSGSGSGRRKPVSRMSVGVQVIAERGPDGTSRFGALMTMRDLDSVEHLGSHLAASERLSAMGRVTAGVAHEVKNPLNAMTTWLGVLKEQLNTERGDRAQLSQQALAVLESEIHRLDRVVKTFLDFTRPVEPDFAEIPLGELLEEVAAVARPQFQRAGIGLSLSGAADPGTVRADRQLLRQAVLNLLINAVEAITGWTARPPGYEGRVQIDLARRGDSLEIRIADNGPGIPPEKRDKVFQLFFTTRKGGTGIGLAMAYRIVQFHHGSIDFLSEASRGATFRIQLPMLSPGSRRAGTAGRGAASAEVGPLRMKGGGRA